MDLLFPPVILGLINTFASCFAANNFIYFRGFMLAYMLLGSARKRVTDIAGICFFVDRHVASWERFLSTSRWDSGAVRECLVRLIREKTGTGLMIHGACLAWVDTTLVSKVRGKMSGVQKWHDHSGNPDRGGRITGHHWALVGIFALGAAGECLCFPLFANLISGHLNPLGFIGDAAGQIHAMTFWDSVCPLICQLRMITGDQPMRIVADAYFSKAPFINRMLSEGVHVVTRMRSDAVGWEDPGPASDGRKRRGPKPAGPPKGKKRKLAELLNLFSAEKVSVTIYGKLREMNAVCRDVWIRGVESQKVRIVTIRTKGRPVILMTTDLTLNAAQIIEIYGRRFGAELVIRDLKQHFGMGDYQCISPTAIIRYACLALTGFCLWRLSLVSEDDLKSGAPLSFAVISRTLRRGVMRRILRKSAQDADFGDSGPLPEEIVRMIV